MRQTITSIAFVLVFAIYSGQLCAETVGGGGRAPIASGGGQNLEGRLAKAYEEYQKRQDEQRRQNEEEQKAKQAEKQADKQADKNAKTADEKQMRELLKDPKYKEMMEKSYQDYKDKFSQAEALFQGGQYRMAASIYKAITMSTDPKTVEMASMARKKLIEIEDLAKAHLANADDAQIERDFLRAVDELSKVRLEFPYTESAKVARARLTALKTRPDVAAHIAYTEAEELENEGRLVEAKDAYEKILNNPRFDNNIAQMKARRRVQVMQEDSRVRGQFENELERIASEKAPALLQSAKNFEANGMNAQAKEKLNIVIEKYPNTTFAKEAEERLGKL